MSGRIRRWTVVGLVPHLYSPHPELPQFTLHAPDTTPRLCTRLHAPVKDRKTNKIMLSYYKTQVVWWRNWEESKNSHIVFREFREGHLIAQERWSQKATKGGKPLKRRLEGYVGAEPWAWGALGVFSDPVCSHWSTRALEWESGGAGCEDLRARGKTQRPTGHLVLEPRHVDSSFGIRH